MENLHAFESSKETRYLNFVMLQRNFGWISYRRQIWAWLELYLTLNRYHFKTAEK